MTIAKGSDMKDVLGAMVPGKRTVLLAVAGALKNVGLAMALVKKGAPIATGGVMICGIISALGAGDPAIVIVHPALVKDMMNVSLATARGKKTAHGVGAVDTKTAITVMAQAR